ncbi:MAG: hypothetical protein U0228_30195 [Myxococcaceae bacterium]
MRTLVNTLLVVISVLAIALGVRFLRERSAKDVTAPPTPVANERCDEARGAVPPVAPELWGAPLAVISGVPVTVDGAPAGQRLTPGVHTLVAGQAHLTVRADAFHAVVVLVRIIEGVEAMLVLGAPCTTCEHATGELNFDFKPGSVGSVQDVARALANADWQLALSAVRAITPEDRAHVEVMFLLTIIHQLAGHLADAREQLEAFPEADPVHAVLRSFDAAETPKKVLERQTASLPARWNALSERYERLSDAFVGDAPAAIGTLSTDFGRFSQRMMSAVTDRKIDAGEATLDDATKELDQVIAELRAMRADCEWQRRVWKAL